MNNDLTLPTGTEAFTLAYSDQSGSKRTSVARGASLPTILTIKHQPYVDTITKRAGTRSVARFDRHMAMADGKIVPVSAYLVVAAPTDTTVDSTNLLAVIGNIVDLIQEDDSGLNLMSNIFVNKEQ